MKKVLALAVTAMMAFTAQALNYTWEQAADGATSWGGLSSKPYSISANTSGTIAANITYGSTLGSGTVLSICHNNSTNVFSVYVDANGNYSLKQNGSTVSATTTTTGTAATAVAGETQLVALSLYRESGSSLGKLEFSVNGNSVALWEGVAVTSGCPIYWLDWGSLPGGAGSDAYTGSATYDVWHTTGSGEVAFMSPATIKSEIAALPEPTAVALLALGVAGLALKRKVK